MEYMSLNDIRESFLRFFETKDHLRQKSFPLVPINDKSILLINAGMTPLKKYFTGEHTPPKKRMVTCQKCIRTPDIERVGITARHGTYFEMLGNFSFGDYFKREAIEWAWEYITCWLKLPREKLWITIYTDDDEAFDIWHDNVGIEAERIVRLGKEDNFWEHGSGPCGPCSEIHYDRGEQFGCGSPDCKPGCDCDRFMEFWNLVFTQFDSDGNGNYTRLSSPNIDTGMGLERISCILQDVNNLFEVDAIKNIMYAVSELSSVKYGANTKSDISLRVITDHIRSTCFMICDGVVPSNEGRGYVLRRLLRRAARHGRLLGIDKLFLSDLVEVVAGENKEAYPELSEKLSYIKKVVLTEEERFSATIDAGLSILGNIIKNVLEENRKYLYGEEIFRLYDTFGFPIDLTREIAQEAKLLLDEETFKKLMREQRERARQARAQVSGWSDNDKTIINDLPKTEFVGYTEKKCVSQVLALIVDGNSVDYVTEGNFSLILDRTVFYGESGGQVGDTGTIYDNDTAITVYDTKKSDGYYIHQCTITEGDIKIGDTVEAEINDLNRTAIRRNHSSAHLLQAALRTVLGNHVEQSGSYVDDKRVRFDFTHFTAVSEKELTAIELLVNMHILLGEEIIITETDIETAKSMGAMALFSEKYGSVVRVVKMGNFSCELCGGTHVDNTAKMGLFKIISESSVAAGIRRIEATTGTGVLDIIREQRILIENTARELKANNPLDIERRAVQLQNELKAAGNEIESLNMRLAAQKTEPLIAGAKKIGGIRFICENLGKTPLNIARVICDDIKSKYEDIVILIAAEENDDVKFISACGKTAVALGAHSGNIVKRVSAFTGGNGGGRPDNAMAGAKDKSKIEAALSEALVIIEEMINK